MTIFHKIPVFNFKLLLFLQVKIQIVFVKNANCSYLCVAEEQNQGPEAQKQDMKIRHHISAALLALFILATAGCASDIDADEAVKSIDSAMSLGDFKTAQRECDNLLSGKTSLDSVSVEQLCHLAVVMAELAENDQSPIDNTAQALLYYRTALDRDSIAAMEYFRALDTDDYKHLYTLKELLGRITDREDGVIYTSDDYELAGEEADSLRQ